MKRAHDLTILLSLKDRVSFTYRWMAYANETKFPFRILIADGGADEKVSSVLSQNANYPNLDFEYIRYPYDQTFIAYYDKMADALSRVETTFVALADNDDFFCDAGLTQSLAFMQAHPNYSACRGRVGTVWVHDSERYGDARGVYGDEVVFHPQLYYNHSLEQESVCDRVQAHFASYSPTWYEIHRTAQHKEAFRLLRGLELSDLYLAELLISGMTVIAGKVRREPCPYLMRQVNTPESGYVRQADGFSRMLVETWSADFKKFVEAMANALTLKAQLSAVEAQDFVRQVYRSYIGASMVGGARDADRSQSSSEKVTWQERIKRALREFYLLGNDATGGRMRQARLLFASSANEEEFKPIKNFLSAGPANPS